MSNNNAVARRPIDKLKSIVNQPTVQEQFKNALGKNSDLFVASLIDVFSSDLQNYDPGGVIQEALKAAVLKLPISKSLGFAYLVPYKGKVQFQIGYKGLIQLAMRSGQVRVLNADVVYEGELKGVDKMRGIPDFSGERTSDKVVGYLSYMQLINGFEKAVYWTKEKVVEHAKAKSPSFKNRRSAWTTDFDAMAIKTTLRALFSKYAPMSIDFVSALQHDEEEMPAKPISIDIEEGAESKDEPAKEVRGEDSHIGKEGQEKSEVEFVEEADNFPEADFGE